MEIRLQAQVECTDGVCGRSAYVLINPVFDRVTHVVVRTSSLPNKEFVVPVDRVAEATADTIRLRCTKAELENMQSFTPTTFIEATAHSSGFAISNPLYGLGAYYLLPYVESDRKVELSKKHKQIPPGEMQVRRGTRVEATDGFVGHVDEFVIDPETGNITHLVMRKGHLWGQKDVSVPVSEMGDTEGNTVYLKINKEKIGSLPAVSVRRRWS